MAAPYRQQKEDKVPLKIVGGVNYGRYNKISVENTYNFIVSDNFLVPYAGYKNVLTASPSQQGRGLYVSSVSNIMIAVIGHSVYRIESFNGVLVTASPVGTLYTMLGDVFIAENNNHEICLTDRVYVYVYNVISGDFKSSNPSEVGHFTFSGVNPGYISFHDGRLIIACEETQTWRLSALNNALSWPDTSQSVGTIQTKPCTIQAVVPMPGGANNVLVFGTNVAESWQDTGAALFPYQRNSTFNLDYGCLNSASIAALENFVVWLSFNEQSGPALTYTSGGPVQTISTDGISFKFGELSNPENCTGFLFRQDGHLIYQFTFPDDNLSYAYDFETKLFFTITDENLNYHIARQVVFFNNTYYFVSLQAGNIYEFSTNYTNADYGNGIVKEIPRIRICPPLRLDDQRYYIIRNVGFTIENGNYNPSTTITHANFANLYDNSQTLITQDEDTLIDQSNDVLVDNTPNNVTYVTFSESVDLSISRDGGVSFGNAIRLNMNPTGQRRSRFIYQRLGIANDTTIKLQFNGLGRFVCTDGVCEVYQ